MYDREIQKLLGLSALCRFVTHESGDRSVHIPVCPVAFSIYLQMRCAMREAFSVKLERAAERWEAHSIRCNKDEFRHGLTLLDMAAVTALQQYRRNYYF